MYLIGIDFGHGETTASYIDTEKPYLDEAKSILNVQKLNILDGDTPEKSKVESAICRDSQEGEWRFVRDCTDYKCSDFYVHFKAPMNEISQEKKNAFSAFVKLVFTSILKNQDFLHYDPETGEKNFCVFAACPSEWNDGTEGQIQKYKEFLNESFPVQWVIKESDAAYFKFKAQDKFSNSSVLVIDIGSSTIDFTAYGESGLLSTEGKKHGASNVEIAIYNHFEQSEEEDFTKAKKEASVLPNIKTWENVIKHFIKGCKEDFYTTNISFLGLDLHNRRFQASFKQRIFDAYEISRHSLENDILSEYRLALQTDMENVKNNIGLADVVILTGGASRMPWLQLLVKDVFSESKVYRDTEPSYVVSDGISSYAYAVHQLRTIIEEIIVAFWKKYNDDALKGMIFNFFNDSLRNKQLPKIKAICEQFEEGKLTYKMSDFEKLDIANSDYVGRRCTAVFVPAMINHNASILNDVQGDISNEVNRSTNNEIKSVIEREIKQAFVTALHMQVPPDINIAPSVNINIGDLQINSEWDIEKIVDMTKKIYEDFFTYGDIYKDRDTKEKRKKFTVPFYQLQEKTNVNLPDEILNVALTSLKSSINKELNVDKLLQKCIFKMH